MIVIIIILIYILTFICFLLFNIKNNTKISNTNILFKKKKQQYNFDYLQIKMYIGDEKDDKK